MCASTGSPMPSTYRTKLALPRCLAVYIATSASRSTESTVAPGTAVGDADAGLHQQAVLADRAVERGQQPAGQLLGVGVGAGEQHRELVAADPHRQAVVADLGAQQLRDRDEQPVADVVAEQVIDGLEVVQVDQQHRRPSRRGQGGVEPVAEQRPVGQPGQAVVADLVLQPLLLDTRVSEAAGRSPGTRCTAGP